MRNLVVVRLLQSVDVAIAGRDGVGQGDDASAPTGTRQPRSHAEIFRDIDELVEVLVAALVERLQAVVRLHHQLRQLVNRVLLVIFVRPVGDVPKSFHPNGF